MESFRILKILSSIVALLALITSSVGLFWNNGGKAFYVNNIYGNSVQMYGNGLYAYDTYFKAPIQKGTDLVTLFLAIPLLLYLILFSKYNIAKYKLLHVGVLSYFLYYSASLAFGVSYNILFLAYILLFSSSLFSFMVGITGIESKSISDGISDKMPRRSIAIFMIFAGLSVFVWLFEIIGALSTGKPPTSLGIYTTEPTYILDLGIIAPSAFTCAILLFRKKPLGYIYAAVLLVLNAFVGVVVISQTIFQKIAGINISVQQFMTFVGVFIIMSLIAAFLNVRLLKNIRN
ncbi:hypothetical protein PQ744_11345 [Thermoanaerobacterium thermosaccharolyticum]|jgi:hypothetical protein|uniref:hypothetical protein n=1 Tax=Thermoanaerobacterium thermosaccharolyticum TaxID=1517 RepID=UPI003D290758